jgi:hypothetical protein
MDLALHQAEFLLAEHVSCFDVCLAIAPHPARLAPVFGCYILL